MKLLTSKPLLLGFLLSLPLWVVFGNYLVAIMVGLLASFLIAMGHALYVMRSRK